MIHYTEALFEEQPIATTFATTCLGYGTRRVCISFSLSIIFSDAAVSAPLFCVRKEENTRISSENRHRHQTTIPRQRQRPVGRAQGLGPGGLGEGGRRREEGITRRGLGGVEGTHDQP